jgi:hypothetical protein
MPGKITALRSARNRGRPLNADLGVLAGHRGPEVGQHAGRESQVGCEGVEVAGPGAGPGADHDLVALRRSGELLDNRVDGAPAPVDDALATDLEDADIRQDPVVGCQPGRPEQFFVGQRLRHEHSMQFGHFFRRVFHGFLRRMSFLLLSMRGFCARRGTRGAGGSLLVLGPGEC